MENSNNKYEHKAQESNFFFNPFYERRGNILCLSLAIK